MKKLSLLISIIIGLAVIGTTIDSRYGRADVQSILVQNQAVHKLEHQEDVLQKRVFDLERRYGAEPTHEQKLDIKEAEIELEKKQGELNRELGLGE